MECGTPDTIKPMPIIKIPYNDTIRVFPNPVTDYFQIELYSYIRRFTITLFDIEGEAIDSKELTGSSYRYDVSGLDPGIYLLRIDYLIKVINKKIVIR